MEIYGLPYNPMCPVVCMGERIYKLSKEAACALFMFAEPLGGIRHASIRARMTGYDWAEEIRYMTDAMYAEAEKIILVMDNTNTHLLSDLYKSFLPEEARRIIKRLDVHYTPKNASWLNIAAIELNVMLAQCVFRQIDTVDELHRQLLVWESEKNDGQTEIQWKYTLADARNWMAYIYPSGNGRM